MGDIDQGVYDRAMDALFRVRWKNSWVDLAEGHRENIKRFLQEYISKPEHGDMRFVGLSSAVESENDLALCNVPGDLFVASSTSGDTWVLSAAPTGPNVFDQVWPNTAAKKVRLKPDPDHWIYFWGIIDYSGANNIKKIYFYNINGSKRGSVETIHQQRFGAPWIILDRGFEFKERGTFDINFEFTNTATPEPVPLAVWIVPGEIILGSTETATYDVRNFIELV